MFWKFSLTLTHGLPTHFQKKLLGFQIHRANGLTQSAKGTFISHIKNGTILRINPAGDFLW
jgi:hypothetical protein